MKFQEKQLMQLTATVFIALILTSVVMTAACPAGFDARPIALASHDASVAVSAFQDAELEAYKANKIPEFDHQIIKQILKDVASAGLTLDTGIRASHNNADAIGYVDAALTQIKKLQSDGELRIKSEDWRNKFSLAMIGTESAFTVIKTLLNK